MDTLNKAYHTFDRIKKLGLYVAIVSVFAIMFYITADVIVRNFLPINMVGTYEFSQAFLMPLIGFPAMPFAYSSGILPRIVMLTDRLKPSSRRIMALVLPIIHFVIFASMGIFSFQYALKSTADAITVLCGTQQIPIYHLYYLPAFSMIMIAIEDVFIFIKNIIVSGRENILFSDN